MDQGPGEGGIEVPAPCSPASPCSRSSRPLGQAPAQADHD